MGYHISSILTISPNDSHSYFAYFIPARRLEYTWINDWVEKNFLKIAESLGPSGVVVAPTTDHRASYLREFEDLVRDEINTLHQGFPLIAFSRMPIHIRSEKSEAIILNLTNCENQQILGSILDVFITVCKEDNWDEIERLQYLDFKGATEVKPNQYTAKHNSSEGAIPTIAQSKKTDIVKVLFLMADPTDASRLRLGEEFREIQEKLKLAKLRDQISLLLPQLSARVTDVSQALLDTKPQIVHFSGHGTSTGALCFENQSGQIHLVQPEALAALFEQFSNQVNCVLMNACYSQSQAIAIAEHIEYVIGMNQAIGDQAAIAFAIGFYQALGAGRTIQSAYKLGCVQIRLQGIPEHLTPVLINKAQMQPQTAA